MMNTVNSLRHQAPRWCTTAHRIMGLTAVCAAITLSTTSAHADGPSWWTNRNVVASGFATNDFAGANQGQVKWLALRAMEEMNTCLEGGAGSNVTAMISSFANSANYCGVNAGQLKNVAKPFWDRLIAVGYTNAYPWSELSVNDYAGVNIGQLKNVFNFELHASHPDFEPTDITLNPTVPTAGQNFTASVTVRNWGTVGNAGHLYIYTDKTTNVARNTPGTRSASLGTLAPNASKTLMFTGLLAGNTGTKTFRAFVDATGITSENCEANNQATLTYEVRNRADLVITSIILDPAVPATDYWFNASIAIKNQGDAVASNFIVSTWAHKLDNVANNAGADDNIFVSSLAPNQSMVVVSSLHTGKTNTWQTLHAFVDSSLVVDEKNEGNNQHTKTYLPKPHADFFIYDISLDPAQPVQGRPYIASVTVVNQGSIAANAGYLYVYDNKATNVAIGTMPTKSVLIGIRPPGVQKVVTIPGLMAGEAGIKTFLAFIDATGCTMEMDENNNQASSAYTVIRLPDLTIPAITLTPTTPSRGGLFSASVFVKNTGSSAASNVLISAWANAPFFQTGCVTGSSSIIGRIEPNQTTNVIFTGLDAGTGTMARTFRAFADSNLQIVESSESNNQATATYTPASRPDFTIMQIDLSTTTPPVGSNFTASVWVKNTGYAPGNAGYVDVWTNKTTNVTAGGTLIGNSYKYVGTLNTNAVRLLTFTGLKAGTNPVSRVFRAVVDSRANTLEVCETNNQDTVTFTPVVQP